jgi:hypothetical protein
MAHWDIFGCKYFQPWEQLGEEASSQSSSVETGNLGQMAPSPHCAAILGEPPGRREGMAGLHLPCRVTAPWVRLPGARLVCLLSCHLTFLFCHMGPACPCLRPRLRGGDGHTAEGPGPAWAGLCAHWWSSAMAWLFFSSTLSSRAAGLWVGKKQVPTCGPSGELGCCWAAPGHLGNLRTPASGQSLQQQTWRDA